MAKQEYYTLKFSHVVTSTDKAVLVSMDENETETLWIPISLIGEEVEASDTEYDVPQWFADKNGWL